MKEYTYQLDNQLDEPILKISKSSMGSYNWCPTKYQFQYIEGRPIDQTEVMRKGTIIHNSREDWFNTVDVKKAESMDEDELKVYFMSLYPIDDYTDVYSVMASSEARRFIEIRNEDALDTFVPVANEVKLDAELFIPQNLNPKVPLQRDYTVHLQGIIDRMFIENNQYIPMELKTGVWKDWRTTSMRKEMAFYKLLFDNCPDEDLISHGLDPNIDITHWGWYYPISNYTYVEEVKKSSTNAVMKGITKLIHSYEKFNDGGEIFEDKFYAKTCINCDFYGICPAAQNDGWV